MEDKNVVFIITDCSDDTEIVLPRRYRIYSNDDRGKACEYITKSLEGGYTNSDDLYMDMFSISAEMCSKGYNAIFEVDWL